MLVAYSNTNKVDRTTIHVCTVLHCWRCARSYDGAAYGSGYRDGWDVRLGAGEGAEEEDGVEGGGYMRGIEV